MENKIIVITGGATGIGFAIAKALTNTNKVISLDRSPAKIAALKAALPNVDSIAADITLEADLENAINHIQKSYGKIDLLINNAGKGYLFDFANTPEKELIDHIRNEMDINYHAPLLLTKKALPLLQKSNDPVVVFTSSGLAYMPLGYLGTYSATKSAVHAITMVLRHQLTKLKIRVVEVLPPVVDTELSKDVPLSKVTPDHFAKDFLKRLEKGEKEMNIGQTYSLSIFSRLMPKLAFKALNR